MKSTLAAAILIAAALTVACAGNPVGPSAPALTVFTAIPMEVAPGAATTLTWTAINASSCTITPTVGVVPCTGSRSFVPPQTVKTVYTLHVEGLGGTADYTTAVYVVAGS
ncbi:MAG: hypothetical protein ABFD60_01780 [Bryobacteraceae bacterium]